MNRHLIIPEEDHKNDQKRSEKIRKGIRNKTGGKIGKEDQKTGSEKNKKKDKGEFSDMCGIVGFTNRKIQAAPVLLEGLSRLEYRGYDSAGIAVRDQDKDTVVVRAKGRLKILEEKTNKGLSVPGTCGIGHTRWATHGAPTDRNAHPHLDGTGRIAVVHNGIIENFQEPRRELMAAGH